MPDNDLNPDEIIDNSYRTHRVPVVLTEELFAFIVEASLKSLKTGGKRLSHTAIIRAMLAALKEIEVDFTGINSESELKERIAGAAKTVRKNS